MSDIATVTVDNLPPIGGVTGDEQIAVYRGGKLGKMPQSALRGTRTFSDPTAPPTAPSVLMPLALVLNDRWRNTATGDEWKVTALSPIAWTPDGNVSGPPGASNVQGPPGATGPRGPDGKTISRIASVTILDNSAVVGDLAGRCVPADPANLSHRGRLLGVVKAGGAPGATITIQTIGDLDGVTGAFGALAPLFIAADGTLTATPPVDGWRQQVGTATTSSHIIVTLGLAYAVSTSGSPVVIAGVPSAQAAFNAVIGGLLQGWSATLPTLPLDGTVPAPGWYRNGDATGFSLTLIS
jgi:hypothetical protein